jgi:hypothetical protein
MDHVSHFVGLDYHKNSLQVCGGVAISPGSPSGRLILAPGAARGDWLRTMGRAPFRGD